MIPATLSLCPPQMQHGLAEDLNLGLCGGEGLVFNHLSHA